MATHKRARSTMKLTAAIATAATAAGVTVFAGSLAGASTPAEGKVYGLDAKGAVSGSYIVLLDQKANTDTKQGLAKEYGGKLKRAYSSAVNGFSVNGLSRPRPSASPPTRRSPRSSRTRNSTSTRPRTTRRRGASTASTRRTPRATRSTRTRTAPVRA